MCDPATALTIASGVASFVGQQQAASAQEAANEQGRQLAIQNQQLQIRALQNQEDEDSKRAAEALADNSRAAEALKATARVSAGEAGISGLSVDALLGDLTRQESENAGEIIQTLDFQQRQRDLQREGTGITTQSQINQLPLVQYPSFFDAAIGTATAAFSTYQQSQALKARTQEAQST